MKLRLLTGLIFIIIGTLPIQAVTPDLYPFNSKKQETQFNELSNEVRCLVCQNQSLADSNAPLAQDLRKEIYHKIQMGYDNKSIKNYLIARYGQFVLFKPDVNSITSVLWIFPFAALILAFLIWIFFQRVVK